MDHTHWVPYVEERIVHDADAHIMETPDWLDPFLDPGLAERMPPRNFVGDTDTEQRFFAKMRKQQADPDYRAEDAQQLLQRKNWNGW
jgi:hypothetical protein